MPTDISFFAISFSFVSVIAVTVSSVEVISTMCPSFSVATISLIPTDRDVVELFSELMPNKKIIEIIIPTIMNEERNDFSILFSPPVLARACDLLNQYLPQRKKLALRL